MEISHLLAYPQVPVVAGMGPDCSQGSSVGGREPSDSHHLRCLRKKREWSWNGALVWVVGVLITRPEACPCVTLLTEAEVRSVEVC